MTFPYNQQAYAQAIGTGTIPAFRFETRDPTSSDLTSTSKLYEGWVNTNTKAIWYLEAINASNGSLTAQWRAVGPIVVSTSPPASPLTSSADYAYPIGQTWVDTAADDYFVMVNNPTATTGYWIKLSAGSSPVELFDVDTSTSPGTDPVGPDADNTIAVTGGQVAAETTANVIRTASLAANAYTVQVQRSTAKATPTVGSNGVSHYDSSHFTVDSDGYVQLLGGGQAIDSVDVDTSSAPGTDPVLPTAAGLITVTGGQVAAATTANVIRTNSLAANAYTIQVQRSKTESSTTVGSNGVCHFDSAYFSLDSNAFVTLASGPTSFTPTLAFGGGSTGITYGTQEGYYYRLGPVVFVSIYLNVTSTGTDTGNATIEGLPITVGSPSSQILEAQADQIQFTANYTYMFGRPITSGTSIQLWESASVSASSSTNLTESSFSASPAIRVQGYYFA